MNSEEILRVIVEAKTGRKDCCDQISVEVDPICAGAIAAFIAAPEAYNANRQQAMCKPQREKPHPTPLSADVIRYNLIENGIMQTS